MNYDETKETNTNTEQLEETYIPELLTLSDEDGEEHIFELLDSLEIDDTTYTALIPYFEESEDMLESDSDLLIMKVTQEDGEDYLSILDDETEFQKVSTIFVEKLSDLYDIED